MREVWIEARGFPGLLVSNFGNIVLQRTMESPNIWVSKGRFYFNNGSKGITAVHIVVARSFLDITSEDFEINHMDGNRQNNAIWNLEVTTKEENQEHAYRLGLMRRPDRVIDLETGIEYKSMHALGQALGLLSNPKVPQRVRDSGGIFTIGGHRIKLAV